MTICCICVFSIYILINICMCRRVLCPLMRHQAIIFLFFWFIQLTCLIYTHMPAFALTLTYMPTHSHTHAWIFADINMFNCLYV